MLANLLDIAFILPGTKVRYGIDGLIGLIPIVGDMITTLISLWIVREARAIGAPRYLVARMLANVALDGAVGIVPLFGDAFDIAFKANVRNVRLLRKWLDRRPRRPAPLLERRSGRVGFFLARQRELCARIKGANARLVEPSLVHFEIGAVERVRRQLLDSELHGLGRGGETTVGEAGAPLVSDRRRKKFSRLAVVERSHHQTLSDAEWNAGANSAKSAGPTASFQ